ncbi:hypothetical protein V3C99_003387, partial [Haemonchus contortus]
MCPVSLRPYGHATALCDIMGLGSPQNGQARQCHRRLLLFNKADSLGRSVALSSR